MADSEYKIILLGDPGVGKTTWFLRVKHGDFMDTEVIQTMTMGVEHLEHRVTVQGKDGANVCVKGFLHDTGGGERFRTLTSNFYRNADAAILMFSAEDRYTFENLQEWVENVHDVIDTETPENFVFALVCNKIDLPLEVEHDSIKSRCESLNTELAFYTSAKTGDSVTESLEKIIRYIHQVKGGRSSYKASAEAYKPTITTQNRKKSCC